MQLTRRDLFSLAAAPALSGAAPPWYRRTLRWGQTNITEKDPIRYDIPFWRDYWKRTRIQGVIINAGGIVAYYPSRFPLHYRAQFLNGRDLYGELCQAARADGLAVLARMDSSRATEDFFRAYPGWFTRDANGQPYRAADRVLACVNSPYFDEYLPDVLREIIDRTHPDGITDNSWAGLGRDSICYCDNCARKFGQTLPREADWNSPVYRRWIEWNYARRLEIWDLNNRVTRAAGGPGCLWIGMNSGSLLEQCRSFRDYREICRRAEIVMLDHQARSENAGFQQNAESGQLIHGLLGWDKLIPESMAMYQAGRDSFRHTAKPAPEARLWMFSGFAGGLQPWWHHVGAWHEDRRAYQTAEPVMRWHEANQEFLVDRRPVAAVGVVWSQRNYDFYGRGQAETLVEAPWRGMVQALTRARIPYLPVEANDIPRDLSALILPNLAAVTAEQGAAIRRFVESGGGLLATGSSTLYDAMGDPRPDFLLADLFRAHVTGPVDRTAATAHTYLRIESGLSGFEDTAILPFGGVLGNLKADSGATVPLTYIPPSPVYPPESAWMRTERTSIPALVLNPSARVAFLPAALDRCLNRDNLPDHARLLSDLVRWVARDRMPLRVEGPGLVDCHLYQQPGRLILHLVNVTVQRPPIDEYIPLGPYRITVKLPPGLRPTRVDFRVSGQSQIPVLERDSARFEIPRLVDHEMAVLA